MEHSGRRAIWGLLLCILFSLPLFAQAAPSTTVVPQLVSYSGVLKDVSGRAATGVTGVTFLIYKDEAGGAPLWLETQSVKPDATGHYTVQLGSASTHGLPAEIFMSGEGRWLAVQIGSEPEQPRVLLVAVPYAMKAADAETLGGLPLSAFVLSTTAGRSSTVAANGDASAAAAPPTTSNVTTAGGTANAIPMFTGAADIENSIVTQTGGGTTAHVGINTATPASTLDVRGSGTFRGTLGLTASGAATATAGKNSYAFLQSATAFNSGTGTSVTQNFRWQVEPVANNTANASGKMNLLFYSGTNPPTETGLSIAGNGLLTFAAGQTFPGAGGGISGVTAGTALTGGGTSGTVTLNVDTTKVPLLNAANIFTNNQSITGSVVASGTVTGSVVNAGTSFNLAGAPFAYGSSASLQAFLGFAGNSTSTGNSNVAVGTGALSANTLGSTNTAIGVVALDRNTSGASNTATGWDALAHNLTGSANTAVGEGALLTSDANYNTASGGMALSGNTTGSSNSALGYNSGNTSNSVATTGSNNTFLGANAGPGTQTNLNNATAIGANAIVSQSRSLVLGGTGVNAVSVGIGTATPASTLDVQGTGNFTDLVTFASGQKFPGTGTITGVTAGTALTGGGTTGTVTLNLDTTKVPLLSAANIFTNNQSVTGNITASGTSTANIINASSAFYLGGVPFAFGANTSVFLGYAGNSTTTGIENTGVGDEALESIAAGQGNTAIGYQALGTDDLGGGNTAIGTFALGANASGSSNTATGLQALQINGSGQGNTADGVLALNSNVLGNFNTASGNAALKLTTGNNNTGIGQSALLNNAIGSYNTAVGSAAGPDPAHNNLTNATAIGANAQVTASNSLVLGSINGINGAAADTFVGIGTTAPAAKLDVHGTANFTGLVTFATGQTFPGAGTITGVTAGTALTGGGTTGNVTLKVDTTKVVTGVTAGTGLTGGGTGGSLSLALNTATTDARYPQLSANNTFSGAQTINNALTVNASLATVLNVTSTISGNHAPIAAFGDAIGDANSVRVYQNGPSGPFTEMFIAAPGTFIFGTQAGDGGLRVAPRQNIWFGDALAARTQLDSTGNLNEFGSISANPIDGVNLFAAIIGNGGGSNSAGEAGIIGGYFGGGAGRQPGSEGGQGILAQGGSGIADPATGTQGGAGISANGGDGAGGGDAGDFFGGNGGDYNGVGILAAAGDLEGTTAANAGEFYGNVTASGSFAGNTPILHIDHPTDPANKYFDHAAIESSEMLDLYTGNAVLDSRGEADVQMPNWFEAVNGDFRYQLTSIGAPGPGLYIAQEIQNGRFKIAGGKPGAKVSWQVTAARQDAYAKAHPLQVEQEKRGRERGSFIHPELYGAPAEKNMLEARHPGLTRRTQAMRARARQAALRTAVTPASAPKESH